jgi:crotonobetaine/carnitine-CoA ligase
VIEAFDKRFGVPVFETYGSTEGNIPVYNQTGPAGACGQATYPYSVRIVDEHDRPLNAGEVGEIVISSSEPWATFMEYWNLPVETLKAVRNFGFHTGDAGYVDEDGNLWFVERLKDMIRRRGENVAARTVEDAVNAIDGVIESAAFAVPSPYGDEDIAVAIVRRSGSQVNGEQIASACRLTLPRFAVPSFVHFVDVLPKTETGKIQKHKLKPLGSDGAFKISQTG